MLPTPHHVIHSPIYHIIVDLAFPTYPPIVALRSHSSLVHIEHQTWVTLIFYLHATTSFNTLCISSQVNHHRRFLMGHTWSFALNSHVIKMECSLVFVFIDYIWGFGFAHTI